MFFSSSHQFFPGFFGAPTSGNIGTKLHSSPQVSCARTMVSALALLGSKTTSKLKERATTCVGLFGGECFVANFQIQRFRWLEMVSNFWLEKGTKEPKKTEIERSWHPTLVPLPTSIQDTQQKTKRCIASCAERSEFHTEDLPKTWRYVVSTFCRIPRNGHYDRYRPIISHDFSCENKT